MMFISLAAFLFLVIVGHYFAWRLVRALGQWWESKRKLILVVFIGVTLIFLGSFMWLQRSESVWLASLYVAAALLFGLLSQLMLLGLIFWLAQLSAHLPLATWSKLVSSRRSLLARSLTGLALLLFLLGTYNAFFPRVKTIVLSGWPESVRGRSFVQLSDLHLGAVYRPVWLERIAAQVNSLAPDFIIISGDLFDGSDETLSEFIPALQSFQAPTILVPGNHDYYVPGDAVAEATASGDIITLSDAAAEFSGIEVVGLNYVGRDHSYLRREITDLQTTANARIAVNHVPVDQAEVKSLEARLMLSGHAHRGQIFPFSIVTSWLYGSFAYGLEDYEGMLTYTSAGTGTWGPPLRTLWPGEIIRFVIE